MPPPIPDTKRTAILEDIRTGEHSARAIAKRHGVAPTTVTSIAKDAGIEDAFGREQTENATRARLADLKALRTEVSEKFLTRANELLDQMGQPHLVHSFGGKDNIYNEALLDRAPTGDLRNLMTSAAVGIDKHLKILQADLGSGADSAASMLGGIADALKAASDALDGQDPPVSDGE